ncbi:MAG: hypothetical protein ACREOI_37230, partial [bacterium]
MWRAERSFINSVRVIARDKLLCRRAEWRWCDKVNRFMDEARLAPPNLVQFCDSGACKPDFTNVSSHFYERSIVMNRFFMLPLLTALMATIGCDPDQTRSLVSPHESAEADAQILKRGGNNPPSGLCAPDQSQVDFGGIGGGSIIVSNEQLVAQTFTAGTTGKLCRVSFHIRKNLGQDCDGNPVEPGKLIVQIRTTESGTALVFGGNYGSTTALIPSGTILANETVRAANVPNDFGWIDVEFSAPAGVTAGQRYALLLTAKAVRPDNACDEDDQSLADYSWTEARGPDGSDLYPAGQMFAINNNLGAWSVSDLPSFPIFDELLFKTYVQSPSAQDLLCTLISAVEGLRNDGVLNRGQAN